MFSQRCQKTIKVNRAESKRAFISSSIRSFIFASEQLLVPIRVFALSPANLSFFGCEKHFKWWLNIFRVFLCEISRLTSKFKWKNKQDCWREWRSAIKSRRFSSELKLESTKEKPSINRVNDVENYWKLLTQQVHLQFPNLWANSFPFTEVM